MNKLRNWVVLSLILLLVEACPWQARGYSLSTHLLLVDLLWASDIRPLLERSFPCENCGPEGYDALRTYAYAGAVIQDAGYYPSFHSTKEFSNLTHYVRTGDFVLNLFRNATDAKELAFAAGALTHYFGDKDGHSLATNLAVAATLGRPGRSVTYEENKKLHKRVEFGFDVNAATLKRLRLPMPTEDATPNIALQ